MNEKLRLLARAMDRALLKVEMTTSGMVSAGPEVALGSIPSSHPLGKRKCAKCAEGDDDCKCPNVETKA